MKVYRKLSEILTLAPALRKDGRRLIPDDLGLIKNGAIVFDGSQIHWVGPDQELPAQYQALPSADLSGHVLTPGLVDSHTHLLFGGDRAQEYAQRLNGVDYQTIANNGGGILHTMAETLKLNEDQLFLLGVQRLNRIASYGVTAVEMKSGYALSREGELALLRAMKRLKAHFAGKLRLFSTFLGAHAVPTNYPDSTSFVKQVVLPTLEQAVREQLVDAVDIFHEQEYFNEDDARLLFEKARALGVQCKIHADEFSDNGGAKLACAFSALSADHLLRTGKEGIQTLANSGTVATLLPGTAFFLGKPLANARGLLDAGAKVALASDYNPGSCHCDNLLLIGALAAPSLKLNQTELWAGITLNAAAALGHTDQGALVPGLRPALALFKADNVSQITYAWGRNLAVDLP